MSPADGGGEALRCGYDPRLVRCARMWDGRECSWPDRHDVHPCGRIVRRYNDEGDGQRHATLLSHHVLERCASIRCHADLLIQDFAHGRGLVSFLEMTKRNNIIASCVLSGSRSSHQVFGGSRSAQARQRRAWLVVGEKNFGMNGVRNLALILVGCSGPERAPTASMGRVLAFS